MEATIALIGVAAGLFGLIAYHRLTRWRSQEERRIKAGKELITAFDDSIRHIKEWDGQLVHVINRLLTDEFLKQKKAAAEFQRHLGFFTRRSFNRDWNKYHDNDEDNPNFMQYLMPETWPTLFLERVDEILNYAKKT